MKHAITFCLLTLLSVSGCAKNGPSQVHDFCKVYRPIFFYKGDIREHSFAETEVLWRNKQYDILCAKPPGSVGW